MWAARKGKGSKVFFFEKKKQKTFDCVEPGGAQGQARVWGPGTSS
jgi:hypothetical protein